MPRRTFTAWLKKQEFRQDGTGHLARYWSEVTPGRINSADGVRRTLEQIAKDGHGSSDAALAAMADAVREFETGEAPLRAVPDAGPFATIVSETGDQLVLSADLPSYAPDDFPRAEAALARARADVRAALGDGDDPAQSRLDAILGQLQAVRIILEDLTAAVAALGPDGAGGDGPDGEDWADAWARAEA